MNKLYVQLIVMGLLGVNLLTARYASGQSVPDTQWSKVGANITSVTDGNLVASIDGLPAGQIAGQGIIKYTLGGNPVWTTLLTGYTDLAGRLGLGKAPFQYVDNVASTTDGGVVVYGREFGTGLSILAKLSAGGLQSSASSLPGPGGTVDDLIGTPDGGFLVVITAFANFTATHKDTYVYKYTSQTILSWGKQIEYPNASPGTVDQSITKAEAAINTPDGGYLLVGYYSAAGPANTIPATGFDPVSTSANASGWVAKLDADGGIAWQKLLTGLPITFKNDGPAAGSLVKTHTLTDVVESIDGTGYALVGVGIGPSSIQLPSPVTCIVELATDGTFKRGLSNGLAPIRSFLTPFTSAGSRYYAIGTTSLLNGADPLLALIDPADLNKVVAQRTFDSPSNTSLRVLVPLSDGSLGFSTSQEIYKLRADDLVGTTLTIGAPTYDCTTGQLTVAVTGGNNTSLEYQILGLRAWGPSPVFNVPVYQRTGTAFTLEARQSGQTLSRPFTSTCVSATATGFALLPPAYDCTTGQLVIQVSGATANVQFRVIGLRDWSPSPDFAVPAHQRIGTTFNLDARLADGPVVSLPFTTACGITSPQVPTSALSFAATTLNCNGAGNAQLVINLVGITFSPTGGIDYKVPGLADWQTSNVFTVPSYQTQGTTFTLYARHTNTQPQFTTQFTTNCPTMARQGVDDVADKLEAVIYPNPVGEQFTVGVRGAVRQTVRFEWTDLQGRLLQSRQVTVAEPYHQETFVARSAPAGLYLLRVSTGKQAVTVHVLKQ